MKRSALITAAIFGFASPGFAEPSRAGEATGTSGQYYMATEKSDFHASKLIGSRVYATEGSIDPETSVDKAAPDWDDIGEVNNLVVGRDGSVRAVVIGVGGFLGIGEKDVALKMNELKFLKKTGDDASDYFIVVKSNKDVLGKAPEYKIDKN